MAEKSGVTPDEWKKFITYVGGFYGNLSNYHSFGHMKFAPELSAEVFKKILYSNDEALNQEFLAKIYHLIEKEIFALDKPYTQLNFPEEGGVTAYFSPNMKKADLALVQEFLSSQKIDVLNTRAFLKDDGSFEITIGCVEQS